MFPEENNGFADDVEEEEDADPLASLTDAQVAAVEARVNAGKSQLGNFVKGSLAQNGLEIAGDGSVVVIDPQRAGAYLGRFLPAGAVAAPAAAAAVEEEDDDEEIPDPTLDKAGFKAWQAKQTKKELKGMMDGLLKPITDTLGQIVQTAQADKMKAAVGQAAEILKERGLEAYGNHPQFAATFAKAAGTMGVSLAGLQDPEVLTRLGFMILPDLMDAGMPSNGKRTAPELDPADARRATGSRLGLVSTRPSNGSRAVDATAPEDIDRIFAERAGIPIKQAQAAGNTDDFAAWKRQQQKAGKK